MLKKKKKEANYQLLQCRRDHAMNIGSQKLANGLEKANDFFHIPAYPWGCSSMND